MNKRQKKRLKKKLVNFGALILIAVGYWVWHNVINKPKEVVPSTEQMKTPMTPKGQNVKNQSQANQENSTPSNTYQMDQSAIPEFDGSTPFVTINNNVPTFTDEEKSRTDSFENYSELDALGRVGVSFANLSKDTMPKYGEKRGSISHVRPSGWGTYRFQFVDGGYLYNRAHMIGWQLSAENDNPLNLATGTRYFNVDGMLPFENLVADYIRSSGNHVLYRVTPVFVGDELLMRGLQMEAYSVEDQGAGVSFNVYVYNAQPGVYIDYVTGTAVSE